MLGTRFVFIAFILCCTVWLATMPGVRTVEPIEDAFGLKLGAAFVPTNAPDFVIGGAPAYSFTPSEPSPRFDFYFVHITPVTHLIHTIGAIGKMENLERCREHLTDLMASLTAKYGAATVSGPVDTAGYTVDYDVIVQPSGKRVGVFCGGLAPIILELGYIDDKLSDVAEDEQLQVTREANAQG